MARLWAFLAWATDPDRIYKVFGYGSLIIALLLLIVAIAGGDTIHWKQWDVY